MKMLQYALVSIFSIVIVILATAGPKPIVYHKRPIPYVHLSAMSYGKKMCLEQAIPVVTVNRERRWFMNGIEIRSFDQMEKLLLEQRNSQLERNRKAYVRCRIDHGCPARDFLDIHALANACGFDGIMVAGTVE